MKGILAEFISCLCTTLVPQVQASFTRDVLWLGPLMPPGTISDGSPTNVFLDLGNIQGFIALGGNDSGFYMQVVRRGFKGCMLRVRTISVFPAAAD